MRIKTFSRVLLGILFVLAGINHFRHQDLYMSIMPPYLPWHQALVIVSGVAEILLGLLMFVPRWSSWAAWGLIALLIAVFPANIQMALHPEQFGGISPVGLWLRLPLQLVLIAWVYWHTRRDADAKA